MVTAVTMCKQHMGMVSQVELQENLVLLGAERQSPAPLLLREGSDVQSPGPGLSYFVLSKRVTSLQAV